MRHTPHLILTFIWVVLLSGCSAHDSTSSTNANSTAGTESVSQQQSNQQTNQQTQAAGTDTSKVVGLWGAKSFDFPGIEFDPLKVDDGTFYINIQNTQNDELLLTVYTAYYGADCLTPQNPRQLRPLENNQYDDGSGSGMSLVPGFDTLEATMILDGDMTIINLKSVFFITPQDFNLCV